MQSPVPATAFQVPNRYVFSNRQVPICSNNYIDPMLLVNASLQNSIKVMMQK